MEEQETNIIIHKAAKKAFDEIGIIKLSTIKSLQVEFAEQLAAKKHTPNTKRFAMSCNIWLSTKQTMKNSVIWKNEISETRRCMVANKSGCAPFFVFNKAFNNFKDVAGVHFLNKNDENKNLAKNIASC